MKPFLEQVRPEAGNDDLYPRVNPTGDGWVYDTPGGAGLTVQDENGTVASGVMQLDFIGADVVAAAGTGEVTVTVSGGGGSSSVGATEYLFNNAI